MSFSRFLSPKNDVAFKKIFGCEQNKDILIHFLNDILLFSADAQITEVEFLNPIQDPEIASQKQSIVDVLCQDKHGVQYIIEMQVAQLAALKKERNIMQRRLIVGKPKREKRIKVNMKI